MVAEQTNTLLENNTKSTRYFYVPCQSRDVNTKADFIHYFRLYAHKPGDVPRLLEQGNRKGMNEEWEIRYGAVMQMENPYPLLD